MLIVGTDKAAVEADLIGGRLGCPNCQFGLRPWGHGVEREVRRPRAHSERRCLRRSICRPCAATHVLVPEDTLLRRRDSVEVIGAALTAKAEGKGHRRIAKDPGSAAVHGAGLAARPSPSGQRRSARALRAPGLHHRSEPRRSLGGGFDLCGRRRRHRRARDRGGPPFRTTFGVVARLLRDRRWVALQHELALPPACVSDKGHLFDHIEEELTHERGATRRRALPLFAHPRGG